MTITNEGSALAVLSGWKLTDEGANNTYTFSGTTIPAGGAIIVAFGTASGHIKWTSANVWNNNGDTAYLYDRSGTLVSQRRGSPMKVTVDRFEGETAVLLVRPEENDQILFPRELLPGVGERDLLEITMRKDEGETEEARERVSSLIEKLRKKEF